VTEIPEHLLKRSKERRQALDPSAASDASPASAPAESGAVPAVATPAAAPAAPATPPSAPPPPRVPVDSPVVAAAKSRRRIPFWAMAVLSLLPVWGFMYVLSVTESEEVVEGPLGLGAEVYNQCSSCHLANGQGGAGRPLWQGSVLATFPRIEDMLNFVYTGSQPYVAAGFESFGDPDREGGAHAPLAYNGAPMPGFGGALTDYQILAVVCHERYTISGADPTSDEWADEYEEWCGPEAAKFAELQSGSTSFAMLEGVGTEPRPSVLAAP
jgi:mono/diheme cytochrome c family protein